MAKRARILLVEDDPIAQTTIGDWLTIKGYDLQITDNPDVALNLVRRKLLDLVLIDLHSCEATQQLADELRADPASQNTRVLVISPVRESARTERVDAPYGFKSYRLAELTAHIERELKSTARTRTPIAA